MLSKSMRTKLNFAKFRRQLKGLKKTTTNIQVVGFTDSDTYTDVVSKGAQALGVKCNTSDLALVCSNGVVPNLPICGKQWNLGDYVLYNGGTQNRSKKVWGVLVPIDADESNQSLVTFDSGISKTSDLDRKRWSFTSDGGPCAKKSKSTTIEHPVVLSSGPLEIEPSNLQTKYCPFNDGCLCTSVVGFGLTGVWRMHHMDFTSCDEDVYLELIKETCVFQPENHGYYLCELTESVETLFKVNHLSESIVSSANLDISTNVTQVTRTSKCQVLDTYNMYGTLLVLSPDHGRVSYTWEKRNSRSRTWDLIDVPLYVCLLYVDGFGDYRCNIGDEHYFFTVLCRGQKSIQDDDMCIDMSELEFGEVVGRGSFATVHRGSWKGGDVALKRLRLPGGCDTSVLPKEVTILRNIRHPNIVTLLAFATCDDEIVLVTNFVNGSNLEKLLFGKEFSKQETLHIAMKIADAVDYMHTRDPIIIHQENHKMFW